MANKPFRDPFETRGPGRSQESSVLGVPIGRIAFQAHKNGRPAEFQDAFLFCLVPLPTGVPVRNPTLGGKVRTVAQSDIARTRLWFVCNLFALAAQPADRQQTCGTMSVAILAQVVSCGLLEC